MEIEKMVFLKVTFTEEEFTLIQERAGNESHGAEAQLIHDLTVKSLRRRQNRGKKGTPEYGTENRG